MFSTKRSVDLCPIYRTTLVSMFSSLASPVYSPDSGIVQKHRLVAKTVVKWQIQTDGTHDDDDNFDVQDMARKTRQYTDESRIYSGSCSSSYA